MVSAFVCGSLLFANRLGVLDWFDDTLDLILVPIIKNVQFNITCVCVSLHCQHRIDSIYSLESVTRPAKRTLYMSRTWEFSP